MPAERPGLRAAIRRMACTHEWVRSHSDYLTGGTVWRCRRCGKQETWPAPKGRMDAEGWCERCCRPVTGDEPCCPHHPTANVVDRKPLHRQRVKYPKRRSR